MELSLEQARRRVLEAAAALASPATETVSLTEACGRILAKDVLADRDAPPFPRAMRDGYAVYAEDVTAGATLHCTGQIRAGQAADLQLDRGCCIEIMTGAAVPPGANAVIMIEYTRRTGAAVTFERGIAAGANIALVGSDSTAGSRVLNAGSRLDYAGVSLLASVGCTQPRVFTRPRVAILSTGDELVEADETPGTVQIRNSNAHALAAQVVRAGGDPLRMPIARDDEAHLGNLIDHALQEADLLLLSGGVSMGKFDLVEAALAARGAEFYFDAVRIRPGRPVVFGRLRDRFFFGLPGNPLSTMITFELFARPMIERLCGAASGAWPQPLFKAELGFEWTGKTLPLTVFLPIALEGDLTVARVKALPYHGSADLAAMAAADGFLVIPPECAHIPLGSLVDVLLK